MATNSNLLSVPSAAYTSKRGASPRQSVKISPDDTDGSGSGVPNKLEEATRLVEILRTNRNLLAQNIVLCDELFTLLKDHKVIPGPMVTDIQNTEDKEEGNIIMLEYVGRLGPRAFYRFCDILGLTGHTFLAEHIRKEAELSSPTNRSDLYEDVFKKFPSILKVLAPGEQRGLTNYIRDKVTDGIIKSTWKTRSAADVKVADDRNKKVTDSIVKDRVIKEKDQEIMILTNLLEDERQTHKKTQGNVAELETRCHDLQVKYNEQLQIMMTSYEASERANLEIEKRLSVFDRQIKAMNVRIQIYFGTDEYSAQADASNVKVSRLDEGVTMILNQLTDLEKEQRELLLMYEEQRRKLFEALGLEDTGQDLKTAYLSAQEKINSEVRRLTAEVDLLSMAFEMDSVWSLFESEQAQKEQKTDGKKKAKGTEELVTDVRLLKTAAEKAKALTAKFDYPFILHKIKERLHEVHMEIEKVKRENLIKERQIGKLQGELDMIKMREYMDDPTEVDNIDKKDKPKSKKEDGKNSKLSPNKSSVFNKSPRMEQSPRTDIKNPSNPPLPPIFGSLTRDRPLVNRAPEPQYESESDSESEYTDSPADSPEPGKPIRIEARLPVIPEIDSPRPAMINDLLTPRNDGSQSTNPRGSLQKPANKLDPGKKYELFVKEKQKLNQPKDKLSPLHQGKPVLGFTDTRANAKLKHAEQDYIAKQYKQPELKKLDFQGSLPGFGAKAAPSTPRRS